MPHPKKIYFDYPGDTISRYYIEIDTSQENNLWEYGQAVKDTFNTPPGDQVLITDSVNPYPPNNISSFTIYLDMNWMAVSEIIGELLNHHFFNEFRPWTRWRHDRNIFC